MPGSDIAGAEGGACFGAGMVCWGDTAGSPSCMVVLLSHATKNQQPFSCSSLSPSRIETLIKLPFLSHQGLADSFINSYTIIHAGKSLWHSFFVTQQEEPSCVRTIFLAPCSASPSRSSPA